MSSTTPLQSLSTPSQTSPEGPVGFWQTQPAPPAQASVPALQGALSVPASKQLPPAGGHQDRFWWVQQLPGSFQQPVWPGSGASVSGASSTEPLQLLSMPSHTSG